MSTLKQICVITGSNDIFQRFIDTLVSHDFAFCLDGLTDTCESTYYQYIEITPFQNSEMSDDLREEDAKSDTSHEEEIKINKSEI